MKKVLLFSCAIAATVLAFKAFSDHRGGNAFKSDGTGVRGGFVGNGNPQYAGGGVRNGFVGGGEGTRPFADDGAVGNGFTAGGGNVGGFTDGGGGVKNG